MSVNVLIVDDNEVNLITMKKILKKLEIEVHTAQNGPQALDLVKLHDYCVILLDVQMPGMNGFEVAEKLCQMHPLAPIPIIFVTAINKDDKFIFKGYEMGAVDYLFKPVESEILRSKVRVFMELQKEKNHAKQLINELTHALDTEKKLQTKLVNDSKMAALGILASGVAHEINNPLAIIVGQVNNIEKKLSRLPTTPSNEELLEFMEFLKSRLSKVAATSHRIAKVIKGMNEFTGDLQKTKVQGDIADILDIQNKIKAFSEEKFKGKGIDFTINTPDFEGCVAGNGSQVALVVLGLLQNSADAINENKLIYDEEHRPWIKVDFSNINETNCKIVVTDSGKGIEEKYRSKIFDPFFTSKDPGKGTGLGLGISRRIIEEFSGELFYNDKNDNTQFVILLKRTAKL